MNTKEKFCSPTLPGSPAKLAPGSARRQPSAAEALLMLAVMFAINVLAVRRVRSFWGLISSLLDNQSY
jgi:hypothetical protein